MIFFLIFARKQDFIFSFKLSQLVTICMNFSWKNKNILKRRLLKILPIEAVLTSTTIYVLEQK